MAWAEQIRTESMHNLQVELALRNREGFPAAEFAAKICGLETNASWWIDHRSATGAVAVMCNIKSEHPQEMAALLEEVKALRA